MSAFIFDHEHAVHRLASIASCLGYWEREFEPRASVRLGCALRSPIVAAMRFLKDRRGKS